MSDAPPGNGKPRKKSGPRTAAGLATVAKNAFQHGGCAATAPGRRSREVRLAQRKGRRGTYLAVPQAKHCPYRGGPEGCACEVEPETRCPEFAAQWRAVYRMCMGMPGARSEHQLAARLGADDWVTQSLVTLVIQRQGIMVETAAGPDAHPLTRILWTCRASLFRILESFGLSPRSLKELRSREEEEIVVPNWPALLAKQGEGRDGEEAASADALRRDEVD